MGVLQDTVLYLRRRRTPGYSSASKRGYSLDTGRSTPWKGQEVPLSQDRTWVPAPLDRTGCTPSHGLVMPPTRAQVLLKICTIQIIFSKYKLLYSSAQNPGNFAETAFRGAQALYHTVSNIALKITHEQYEELNSISAYSKKIGLNCYHILIC